MKVLEATLVIVLYWLLSLSTLEEENMGIHWRIYQWKALAAASLI
jgi:hypothetical protein